jgi:hypothetical protein
MSHTVEIKTIQQVMRWQVMKLLEWDEAQYGEFQMNQAYTYVERAIGLTEWGVAQLMQTPDFWAWWRNHWHKRDMGFVPDAKKLSLQERRLFYEITHDAEAIGFTPHQVVMEAGLAGAIKRVAHAVASSSCSNSGGKVEGL